MSACDTFFAVIGFISVVGGAIVAIFFWSFGAFQETAIMQAMGLSGMNQLERARVFKFMADFRRYYEDFLKLERRVNELEEKDQNVSRHVPKRPDL